ncbi:MAG: polyisoprenoid-binding protein [Phenylobacterium sp.]|nr:MAG: polyisoprenoid-binding protein [Phenylobacterium sp.]
MIRTAPAALALSLALGAAAFANPVTHDPAKVPAGTYVLDKRHASLTAKLAHLGGFSRYTLRFGGLDGGFTYDPANWQATKLSFTVDPKSVDTGDAGFNKQIAGYFHPDKYPAISFVSTAITANEAGEGQVTGDLTFNGVTRPVTLNVTFNGEGPGLLGVGTRMGFSGTTRIKRSDFHESAVSQWAGDDVDLLFEVEFTKK